MWSHDAKLPFLAATLDELIGENGIIEIKCPASCSDLSPEEAILSRKVTFWKIDRKTKTILDINKKYIYYFQIQGQLHISRRKYRLFALWTPKGLKTHHILKHPLFWQENMEQKLKQFYFDCLLPEIIDARYILEIYPSEIKWVKKEKNMKKMNNSYNFNITS